ncbi:hypothetical protein CAXC1_300020 [Candidatus Xenohaliotis californiensis]|uniref:Uncharacterized protein n=1 Tax=Candidatus Xenohaliotis californiensis TaxID=84677 RepID=A0ABP0ESZ2_9RICK|nr:hypothetical protein CAXC1_300020 [Candidatus Xenohaliotis californiensis]
MAIRLVIYNKYIVKIGINMKIVCLLSLIIFLVKLVKIFV